MAELPEGFETYGAFGHFCWGFSVSVEATLYKDSIYGTSSKILVSLGLLAYGGRYG